jgi:hypothetical protein
VLSVFQNSKPRSPNIKVVLNFLEHALEKFELKPISFGTVLAPFDLRTRQSDTGTLATLQLSVPSLKPCDVHTQKTKHCQGNKSFTTILPKFAKICAQSALELWQKQQFHVFDRGWHPRFTPVRAPARARRSTAARAPCRAYKAARASTIPPRALTSPAQAKDRWNSPRARRATVRQAFRASSTVGDLRLPKVLKNRI